MPGYWRYELRLEGVQHIGIEDIFGAIATLSLVVADGESDSDTEARVKALFSDRFVPLRSVRSYIVVQLVQECSYGEHQQISENKGATYYNSGALEHWYTMAKDFATFKRFHINCIFCIPFIKVP